VAVVDVRMPPGFKDEGLKAALEARRRIPGLPVLVLSQYVEERYGRELLESGMEGTGYLLKDRVADVGEFVSAVETVGSGGTVLDPEVVGQLLARSGSNEGLALVAEGRTNGAIGQELFITGGAVEKHVKSIFGKLGLAQSEADHRRVLAVLAYLRG
jgi:DNA-binding NarL/FixJ family response regulator